MHRLEEASEDLDRAYQFLALMAEAVRLPEPHRQMALRAYDYLLWRFSDRVGVLWSLRTRLLYERVRPTGWRSSGYNWASTR